ncbi:hypothetical protein RB195_026256 [Necator americanus]|uniref:Uncharacterized protein n=1 Tax=Necator americanus TaxID=51031 RepID=A0ABR1EWL7_NECAM
MTVRLLKRRGKHEVRSLNVDNCYRGFDAQPLTNKKLLSKWPPAPVDSEILAGNVWVSTDRCEKYSYFGNIVDEPKHTGQQSICHEKQWKNIT